MKKIITLIWILPRLTLLIVIVDYNADDNGDDVAAQSATSPTKTDGAEDYNQAENETAAELINEGLGTIIYYSIDP